jgi:hypothetical protein
MPDEVRASDGGLGAPAKRGRPRKGERSSEPENGNIELARGDEEPVERTEDRKFSSGEFTPIDPLSSPPSGGDSDRPRRGRKPGGRNRPKEKEETISNLSSLASVKEILQTSALFLAGFTNEAKFEMADEQADKITAAIERLCVLYPVGLSEKRLAWINLTFALGGWAGPGVVAMWQRPPKPKPRVLPTPIRDVKPEASPMEPGPYATPGVNGLAGSAGLADPITGAGATPETAKNPSQMWNQPGDIIEDE